MSAATAFPNTDDYATSSALGEAEISRLIKTAQAAQFVARDGVPKKTESNFKPRSLVEIAFEAEKVRQDAETSYNKDNMFQPGTSENSPSAQHVPSGSNPQTSSILADQTEHEAEVPQISEQQAEINALQAQHDAELAALRAELEVQQQIAEKQAYDRGMTAGIEAAKSAEPSEEERALDERRQAEHGNVISRLEACVASAAGPDAIDDQELVRSLQIAVTHLASQRAGTAIAENPEGISARIVRLAERVKQKSETVIVSLNPEDLIALTAYESGPLSWKYVADEALLSGDIRISLDTIDIADILTVSPQKSPQSTQPYLDSETQVALQPQLDTDKMPDADSELVVGDVVETVLDTDTTSDAGVIGDSDTSGEDE
jgi:flagellar biosynthesis/type III secretory pathway protein FliH